MKDQQDITSEHLADKENHVGCECGNTTIYEYSWQDHDGMYYSCPICMVAWQHSQVQALKKLLYQLSTKSKEETALEINKQYAEIMGCKVEDFIEEHDYSKL